MRNVNSFERGRERLSPKERYFEKIGDPNYDCDDDFRSAVEAYAVHIDNGDNPDIREHDMHAFMREINFSDFEVKTSF